MPPAEQHALVLEELCRGRAGAKSERRRNGQGCNQDCKAHRKLRISIGRVARQANGKEGENKAALVSFSLDICCLDDRPPFLNFSLVQSAQYLWRVLGGWDGLLAE